jgi:hypothetical protein
MSQITVTVYKHGLALESELNKKSRQIQDKTGCNWQNACTQAEKELDPIAYTQITHSDSKELDLQSLGQHIAKGAPFNVERSS